MTEKINIIFEKKMIKKYILFAKIYREPAKNIDKTYYYIK